VLNGFAIQLPSSGRYNISGFSSGGSSMADRSSLIDAVGNLSADECDQVMSFIDKLRNERVAPRPGSVEAVLKTAGTWWMTREETEQFLSTIQEMRRVEDSRRGLPVEF
jgi:hypothetical protein